MPSFGSASDKIMYEMPTIRKVVTKNMGQHGPATHKNFGKPFFSLPLLSKKTTKRPTLRFPHGSVGTQPDIDIVVDNGYWNGLTGRLANPAMLASVNLEPCEEQSV